MKVDAKSRRIGVAGYVFSIALLMVLPMFLGVQQKVAHSAPVQPEALPPPRLVGTPATPATFSQLTPAPDSMITNHQPDLSVHIASEEELLNTETLQIGVESCVPESGRTLFTMGDTGWHLENFVDNEDNDFPEIAASVTLRLDLAEAGCTLANGEFTIVVVAVTGAGSPEVLTSQTMAWTFNVSVPNNPILPLPVGPVIERLEPSVATPGTEVMVKGSGFQQGTLLNRGRDAEVLYDGAPIPSRFIDAQTLQFTVPEGACGKHLVQVHNPMLISGPRFQPTSEAVDFVIPIQLCVQRLARGPVIESLFPSSGSVGTQVAVRGSGFNVPAALNRFEGARVLFNGAAVSTTVLSATELTFTIPADALCGNNNVQVSNGALSIGGSSEAYSFQASPCFSNPQPAPESTSPDAPPAIAVNVNAASGFNVLASSIELSISSCAGLIFKTITGATYSGSVFTVSAGTLNAAGCTLAGTLNASVIARDSAGNEGVFTWSFTVEGGNRPPTLSLLVNPTTPQAGDTVTIIASASDPDGDLLRYTWYMNGQLQNIDDNDVVINNIQPGQYLVRVEVSDGYAHPQEVAADLLLDVPQLNGNHLPYVVLTMEPVSPPPGGTLFTGVFAVSASDADGDVLNPLTFEWYANDLNDGQPEFRLRQQNGVFVSGAQNQISFNNAGEYTIRVRVPDGQGGVGQDVVQLSVSANGPSPSPAPSPDEDEVLQALDTNGNGILDDAELTQAMAYWAKGQAIPSSGEMISDCMIKALIAAWVTGRPPAGLQGCDEFVVPPSSSAAGGASLEGSGLRLWAPAPLQRELRWGGAPLAWMKVQVFDLQGNMVLEQEQPGSSLTFALMRSDGLRLANGVYLYVVQGEEIDGRRWQSTVRKLTVLR